MRTRVLFVQVALLLSLCGCALPGVAWRSDSSGFVYADRKGDRLLEFDLKTKKSTVLVAKTGSETVWPALSPDGKRLAVARCEKRKGMLSRLQVVLYGIDGKEQKRSSWIEVGSKKSDKDSLEPSHLFWGAPDRILVVSLGTHLYDLPKDTFTEIMGLVPWVFGIPAVRPDGKGFLAYQEIKSEMTLFFVDWEGKKHVLEGKLPPSNKGAFLLLSEWDRDTAVLTSDKGIVYEADTSARTVKTSKRKPVELLPAEGERLVYHVFPGSTIAVCLFRVKVLEADRDHYDRIEVQDLNERKRTVVKENGQLIPLFFPSPDRKYLALFYESKNKLTEAHILVFDSTGKVAADVPLEK